MFDEVQGAQNIIKSSQKPPNIFIVSTYQQHAEEAATKPAFKRHKDNQTEWVWERHPNVKRVLIGHVRERKEFGGSDQKCLD